MKKKTIQSTKFQNNKVSQKQTGLVLVIEYEIEHSLHHYIIIIIFILVKNVQVSRNS